MKAKIALLTLTALFMTACASPRPVLVPNKKYERVGEKRANKDIDQCFSKTESHLAKSKDARRKKAIQNGALGGLAIGGVVGATRRGGGVGRNAVAGGALGAGAGALMGMATGGNASPELQRNMIDGCLEDKGYRVAGWE